LARGKDGCGIASKRRPDAGANDAQTRRKTRRRPSPSLEPVSCRSMGQTRDVKGLS